MRVVPLLSRSVPLQLRRNTPGGNDPPEPPIPDLSEQPKAGKGFLKIPARYKRVLLLPDRSSFLFVITDNAGRTL